MNAKSILFPTDFSGSSEAALRYASALAAESGAMLHIIHVGNDSSAYLAGYGSFTYAPNLADDVARENRAQLEKIEPLLPHVRHKHHYLTGDPEQEILALAEREDADLIVIGSHGRTGITRLLLGSVAEGVVRCAKCPVLTVKQPQGDDIEPDSTPDETATDQPGPISKHSLH